MKLSAQQELVLSSIASGRNVLVTGAAGTGKSTLLRAMREQDPELPVVASTGIAAVQVGGTTVHSWAGIGLGEDPPEEIAQKIRERGGGALKRIQKSKRLALDEVSMIPASLFALLDRVFRLVREQDRPFGGLQLVLFGDFLQLPPVTRRAEQDGFAFESPAWQEAAVQVFHLTHVFRQEDRDFAAALNCIRRGELTDEVRAMLSTRYQVEDSQPELTPVTVYTHNADVDADNMRQLRRLPGKEVMFRATDWGEPSPLRTLQKNCLAPEDLRLREGAQVMLLRNLDPEAGLANGTLGTVLKVQAGSSPLVRFANGEERKIDRFTWEMRQGKEVVAERLQYPLRLAWAITVHKSQGMTLDKIRVHLDRAFEYGQSYVALSRARALQGLFIQSSKPGAIRAHPKALEFYDAALK